MYAPAENRYRQMSYARCGRSGVHLPRISLGLWQNFGGTVPYESSREMVLKSFDHGVTHFDLANNYGPPPGSAEETFGRVLVRDLASHRDELIISTKAGYRMWPGPYGEWGSRKYLLASLDQSLKRMGSSTSTSSIRTGTTRIRRSRRPWAHSTSRSGAVALSM